MRFDGFDRAHFDNEVLDQSLFDKCWCGYECGYECDCEFDVRFLRVSDLLRTLEFLHPRLCDGLEMFRLVSDRSESGILREQIQNRSRIVRE